MKEQRPTSLVLAAVGCPAPWASPFTLSLPAPGQHQQGRVEGGSELRAPRSWAAAPAGPAQLHNPSSPDTGRSLEGKRLTQLPALRPRPSPATPASPSGARSWNWLPSRVSHGYGSRSTRLPLPRVALSTGDLADCDYNSRRGSRPDQWRAPALAERGACAAV